MLPRSGPGMDSQEPDQLGSWTDRIVGRQTVDNPFHAATAVWMLKLSWLNPLLDDEVVIPSRANSAGHIVQVQGVSHLPGHSMIGAGSVTAHP